MPRLKHNPIPEFNDSDKRRFNEKVDQRGPDECWPWKAGRFHSGYGRFKTKLRWRNLYSHRVAFFLATGIDPLDKCVCHSCDNPPCCNPAHLSLGTQKENIGQMWNRKRSHSRLGERNPRATLTFDQVEALRCEFDAGTSRVHLVEKYGISKTQLFRIGRRTSWGSDHTPTEIG